MKRASRLVLFVLLICFCNSSVAQDGPPPPPPNNPSYDGNDPVGGGAPVGDGMYFLFLLGAGYAMKKIIEKAKTEFKPES